MSTKPHTCAWPQCLEEGTFRAPVDVRDLTRRQYFCAKHIKEFNAKWDGLTGFSPDEIFTMQTGGATWNRPTWKMGVESASWTKTSAPGDNSKDFYKLFGEGAKPKAQVHSQVLPPEAQAALLVIDVPVPFSSLVLKNRYRQLVKENHPDISKQKKKAEEKLKQINEAYAVLKKYITD